MLPVLDAVGRSFRHHGRSFGSLQIQIGQLHRHQITGVSCVGYCCTVPLQVALEASTACSATALHCVSCSEPAGGVVLAEQAAVGATSTATPEVAAMAPISEATADRRKAVPVA